MNLDQDERALFSELAEHFPAREPDSEFARRVVSRAAQRDPTIRRYKPAWAGMSLAAIVMVSGAAAAAWSSHRPTELSRDTLPSPSLSSLPRALSVAEAPLIHFSAVSEPDSVEEPPKVRRAPRLVEEESDAVVEQPLSEGVRHPVHLPPCECGPHANICGCSN